jgi:transketolase
MMFGTKSRKRVYKDLKLISKNAFIRDVLIQEIKKKCDIDKNIFFLSADMGAPALDALRKNNPKQFIHCGISEQHMVSFAAGMALEGNKTYCYALAPFITERCYEQVKCSIAAMSTNVTLLGLGVGLSYADAGPTHYGLADLSIIKALPEFQIYTPCDALSAKKIFDLDFSSNKPSYIRIERDDLDNIYNDENIDSFFKNGFNEIVEGENRCIITSGYCLHIAKDIIQETKKNIGLIDLYQHSPIKDEQFKKILEKYQNIVIIDEQTDPCATEMIILKLKNKFDLKNKVQTFCLKQEFFFQNGGRDFLLKKNGIDPEKIIKYLNS